MSIKHYLDLLTQAKVIPDTYQIDALKLLADLDQAITQKSNWPFKKYKKNKLKGLYIWGSVGRGKTFLMDLFFKNLKTNRKVRFHFQTFMQMIHNTLFKLSGQPDPLKQVSSQLARETDIICLDELFIEDIADAMLVGGLFKFLYDKAIVLVMTSNLKPDDLYLHGTNRALFLPAIEQIKSNNKIICLEGEKDYRLLTTPGSHFFFGPKQITDLGLSAYSNRLFTKPEYSCGTLIIQDRTILFNREENGIIWFDFKELCEKPRAKYDYIYIAQHFHTVLISHIPQLDAGKGQENKNTDRTRRFISLIDALYDQSINLVASFEVELNQLYLGKKLHFQFRRTYSRLVEMQGKEKFTGNY